MDEKTKHDEKEGEKKDEEEYEIHGKNIIVTHEGGKTYLKLVKRTEPKK